MTPQEGQLWAALASHPDMPGWTPQYPFRKYVLDFYNPASRLCVEVDGKFHEERLEQRQHDWRRTKVLHQHRVTTLRFSNIAIAERIEYVLPEIIETHHKLCSVHSAPDIEWYRFIGSSVR